MHTQTHMLYVALTKAAVTCIMQKYAHITARNCTYLHAFKQALSHESVNKNTAIHKVICVLHLQKKASSNVYIVHNYSLQFTLFIYQQFFMSFL